MEAIGVPMAYTREINDMYDVVKTWNKSSWRIVIKTKPVGRVEVEDALNVAYQNDISSIEAIVNDKLVGELQHNKGIYEEFDASVVNSNPTDLGEGSSGVNKEECQTDEYETSEKESFEEDETSDEKEFNNDYESSEDD
ncbi:hypothetical protein HAX54_027093 [Datura stramonium]|uniref:Uncharacterized protein n=1 Tax=Datura stramonium TaxID=4076 RepID=A0ABS8V2C1_DATST|nr:hypothetical protein [Datura stramonium]